MSINRHTVIANPDFFGVWQSHSTKYKIPNMPDKILTCQNCHNSFVYSEYEQIKKQKELLVISSKLSANQESITNSLEPLYCPICASIKASEAKHPPKPQKA